MPPRHERSNRGLSAKRWKDGRRLRREVFPTLPSPTACAVLSCCWFHAEYTPEGWLVFDLTSTQIADECAATPGTVQKTLQKLTAGGVLETSKGGCNVGGRSLGSERRITFRKYEPPD